MVGGVADWFAVTALFRRPLGLPIPHTAVIVERKDQFAETLGQFVQENFLNADVLADRIRSAGPAPRLAAWLADDGQCRALRGSRRGHRGGAGRDAARRGRAAGAQRRGGPGRCRPSRWRRWPAVRWGDDRGRSPRRTVQRIVSAADRYLADHYEELRERFEAEAPRWLPDAVYGRAFDRLHARAARAPRGDGRRSRRRGQAAVRQVDRRTARTPPDVTRAARARRELQARPAGQSRAQGLDLVAVEEHQGDPAGPGGRPRLRAAPAAGSGARPPPGAGSAQTRTCRRASSAWSSRGARTLAEQFHDELADLVTGTIKRWDAAETSTQLELLLGRDLQFIRINGTVVGAGVGIALHAIALAFG